VPPLAKFRENRPEVHPVAPGILLSYPIAIVDDGNSAICRIEHQ
jgi:hypothetical protein